jgi:integrase
LLKVLRPIESKGFHETAHRVRSLCSRAFRYAIATGRAERDPAADLQGALVATKTQNFAAVTIPREIGALLRAIDDYRGQPSVMVALKLAPLVFVCPGELRAAEWDEFDLDAAEWRISAKRTKMRVTHIVPLSTQAVEILMDLQPITGGGRFLFPSLRSPKRCMSDNTLNAALRRMGFGKDEMTTHGFRSIASTSLNELGYLPDVIELQLAHIERNKVRSAYNRSERLAERRKMMQEWANYLDQLKSACLAFRRDSIGARPSASRAESRDRRDGIGRTGSPRVFGSSYGAPFELKCRTHLRFAR